MKSTALDQKHLEALRIERKTIVKKLSIYRNWLLELDTKIKYLENGTK